VTKNLLISELIQINSTQPIVSSDDALQVANPEKAVRRPRDGCLQGVEQLGLGRAMDTLFEFNPILTHFVSKWIKGIAILFQLLQIFHSFVGFYLRPDSTYEYKLHFHSTGTFCVRH
jgi:hypothetical protein